MSKLIRYADGTIIEVAGGPGLAEPISGRTMERVGEAFQAAAEAAATMIRPVVSTIGRTVREAGASDCEIEFGFAFTIEGNIFLTKATGEASLKVTVKIGSP